MVASTVGRGVSGTHARKTVWWLDRTVLAARLDRLSGCFGLSFFGLAHHTRNAICGRQVLAFTFFSTMAGGCVCAGGSQWNFVSGSVRHGYRTESTDLVSDRVCLAKRTERILGLVRTLSVLYFLTESPCSKMHRNVLCAELLAPHTRARRAHTHTHSVRSSSTTNRWNERTHTHAMGPHTHVYDAETRMDFIRAEACCGCVST